MCAGAGGNVWVASPPPGRLSLGVLHLHYQIASTVIRYAAPKLIPTMPSLLAASSICGPQHSLPLS
eukprot:1812944-Rhodomonas_salina.2